MSRTAASPPRRIDCANCKGWIIPIVGKHDVEWRHLQTGKGECNAEPLDLSLRERVEAAQRARR